jgi:ADP-heptose:LPS heptosyltransferase
MPGLRALRRQYPDARLAYLVEPGVAPVVLSNPVVFHESADMMFASHDVSSGL